MHKDACMFVPSLYLIKYRIIQGQLERINTLKMNSDLANLTTCYLRWLQKQRHSPTIVGGLYGCDFCAFL